MTFLVPIAALFALLVPVIVLFYILRAQYERIPVPSTWLWRNVVRDTEGRPTWRPPIRNILLLLQILIALLGAFALMRPATLGEAAKSHILIIDASMSMQSTDVAPNRFEEAKRQAAEIVRAAQDGDAFALIRMGNSVDVVERATSRAQLLQAISTLTPGVTGSDVRNALQVAGAIAREQTGYRSDVVILSDGAFGELPPLEAGIADLRVQTIGSSSDNQAIVQIRVRRIIDGSNRQEGFARIANYGPAAVEVAIRALGDSVPLDNRRVRIAARGTTEIIVPLNPNVKHFEVNIDRADLLPLDNYAQVVVPSEDIELTLVSGSATFFERALTALPGVRKTVIRPQQYKKELGGAITVFDGYLPRTRDNLPPASMLIVNPPVSTGGIMDVAELRQPQQVIRINPRSPLLDAVDLSGVFLPKALRVAGLPGTSPIVESKDAGLVWEGVDEGRKVVVFGFDPRQPEIGQRLAFPILLANAISWLGPNAGSSTLAAGQSINLQPLRDARDVLVRDPNGKSYVFPITDTTRGRAIPFAQTDLIGRYAVVQRGEKGPLSQGWFTVNGGEEDHSDIRPRTFAPQSASSIMSSALNAVNLELWPYLAAIALAFLAIEWIVYVRR